MNGKWKAPFCTLLVLYSLLLSALFQSCYSAFHLPRPIWKKQQQKSGSSFVFPLAGNVYPKGYYQVTLEVGQPPKPYSLDIDTGSDLTWLQCDAPCAKCTPAPHSLYKPNKNVVMCKDPLCTSLHWPKNHPCHGLDEQCDYEVAYADRGSSLGVLVKDMFPLRFTNGSIVVPHLVFGCGYSQEVPASTHPPFTDGILGLGNGKSSIVSQLSGLGLIRNVVGHCLSGQGGGFLFFGDDILPSSGIAWTPIVRISSEKHFSLGPAELFFDGQATGVKGFPVIFDSGSTFSYFSSEAYDILVSSIKKNINAKQLTDAVDDKSLPVCWNGSKSFKSVNDATSYFKPLTLSFMKAKNVELQLQPEAYLILTEHGNVCLGILNGTEVGLGNYNVIGDISLLDKMVIYDNEKQQVGWLPANCNRLPISRDHGEYYYDAYPTNMGIFEQICPAKFDSSKQQARK
ncbi:aspartic proteinase Asp1 [Nicotiana tabacum]|uniref:Aspartic proteinase Asp1 n=2 Tax=Nicotiana TaxID=4085 RepID=A0A1S4BFL2_TOBAC|nr:PREDICTED: aspartic proteinase Asp1-like [Nicotiana sylvestris]XP_016487679.1 PREDICTED: aspartic proteinase Asp1-like [Nicotiana tabacum]